MSNKSNHYPHLDMLRGVAALVVVAEHSRAFIFVPLAKLQDPNLIVKAFYALTSLGHQAVMIFFALSGFLVGGKALRELVWGGGWSWPKYALRRLTRLWVVVVPALVFTLLLDWMGMAFGGVDGYTGMDSGAYASLPAEGSPADHSPFAFIGNILFLQTISSPVYGSNGPLWSLAYEFWYYVLFPVVMSVFVFWRSAGAVVINTVLAALIIWMLPVQVLAGGLIWIAGAIAGAATPALSRFSVLHSWPMALFGLMAIIAMMMVAELKLVGLSDLLLGCTVAVALPFLALTQGPKGWYENISRGLAEISYTLYVTHFPLLMAATMILLAPDLLQPGVGAFAWYGAFVSGALIWAIGSWACFERHTNRVYMAVSAWLRRKGGNIPETASWKT